MAGSNRERQFDWSRMSDEASETIAAAADEARRLNDDHSRAAHLLIALLRVNRGVGSEVLKAAGIDLHSARTCTSSISDEWNPLLPPILLTAMTTAMEGEGGPLTTGHLLLAIITSPDSTSALLEALGLEPSQLVDQVRAAMGRTSEYCSPMPTDHARATRRELLAEVDRLCNFIGQLPNGWNEYFLPLAEELRRHVLDATGGAIQLLLSPADDWTPSENLAASHSMFVERISAALAEGRSLLRSKGFDPK
jgi:ATP-dependent Clp protease ATP-binding subunit ClpA